jgi:hypothetical protein
MSLLDMSQTFHWLGHGDTVGVENRSGFTTPLSATSAVVGGTNGVKLASASNGVVCLSHALEM